MNMGGRGSCVESNAAHAAAAQAAEARQNAEEAESAEERGETKAGQILNAKVAPSLVDASDTGNSAKASGTP